MYYTGITWNLRKRIFEHNSGINTPIQKSRLPVKLVYWKQYSSRVEAAKKEKEIKGWSRKKKELLIHSIQRQTYSQVYVEEQRDETGTSSVG